MYVRCEISKRKTSERSLQTCWQRRTRCFWWAWQKILFGNQHNDKRDRRSRRTEGKNYASTPAVWGTRLGFLGRNTIGKHRRRMARKFERIPYKDVSSSILTPSTCRKGTEFTSPVYSYDTQSNASQTPGIADLSGGRGERRNIPRPTLKKTPCRFRSFGDRHTHTHRQDVRKIRTNRLTSLTATLYSVCAPRRSGWRGNARHPARVSRGARGSTERTGILICTPRPVVCLNRARRRRTGDLRPHRRLKFPCFFYITFFCFTRPRRSSHGSRANTFVCYA